MRSETLVAVFSPDFTADDILVHTDLCREYSAGLEVHAHVLRAAADVDRIARRYRGIEALAVWNLYMEVDEVSLRLLAAFGSRLAGSNHTITARTVRKSAMYEVFDKTGINRPWSITIENAAAIDRLQALLEIPFPVIVKVDQGYNSVGLSPQSICADLAALKRQAQETLRCHGPITVQRFVEGREFTIAVANNRAFKPVEKIFKMGQPVYLPDVPYTKRYCTEPELDVQLRTLAERAARAFGIGPAEYCRVDFRQDRSDGCLYPIDVNDMCSVWPASQFEVSLAGDGASRKDLIGWMFGNRC